jgi:cell fate (sporulation/competence/biofilm development) regulator YlbF (YheA/YmcA/DUF963 family)
VTVGHIAKAKELGNALGRTDEYQTVKRSIEAADGDRELAALRKELEGLEGRIEASLKAGQEPDADTGGAYDGAVGRLQASATYQRLVSAQSNFDKLMGKVNQAIAQGMEEGVQNRIILA